MLKNICVVFYLYIDTYIQDCLFLAYNFSFLKYAVEILQKKPLQNFQNIFD